MGPFLHCNRDEAGVVKLVDAEDSKSSDPCGRVGSIPTSGTNKIHNNQGVLALPSPLTRFGQVSRYLPSLTCFRGSYGRNMAEMGSCRCSGENYFLHFD
jgi:hypothetical protein